MSLLNGLDSYLLRQYTKPAMRHTADEEAIRRELAALVKARGTQTALAAEMGISLPYLSDVLAGNRRPGPTILAFLGYRRAYEKIA